MEKEEISKHKLDYIKGWCELIISLNNKREPESNEFFSEWIQGRNSLAKDFLKIINRKD
tara:strand:+ start:340 stop:516 length:177 start_codon:yes stop_codon:yes gene_type:complete